MLHPCATPLCCTPVRHPCAVLHPSLCHTPVGHPCFTPLCCTPVLRPCAAPLYVTPVRHPCAVLHPCAYTRIHGMRHPCAAPLCCAALLCYARVLHPRLTPLCCTPVLRPCAASLPLHPSKMPKGRNRLKCPKGQKSERPAGKPGGASQVCHRGLSAGRALGLYRDGDEGDAQAPRGRTCPEVWLLLLCVAGWDLEGHEYRGETCQCWGCGGGSECDAVSSRGR